MANFLLRKQMCNLLFLRIHGNLDITANSKTTLTQAAWELYSDQ
jgi:hypothetical protein